MLEFAGGVVVGVVMGMAAMAVLMARALPENPVDIDPEPIEPMLRTRLPAESWRHFNRAR